MAARRRETAFTCNSLDWKQAGGSPECSPDGTADRHRPANWRVMVVPHQEISSHLGRRFVRVTEDAAPRANRWSNLRAKIAMAAAWLAGQKRRIVSAVRALGPYAA